MNRRFLTVLFYAVFTFGSFRLLAQTVVVFTNVVPSGNTTWTCPDGVISVFVECWGSGGGGGAAHYYATSNSPACAGGGGGSGSYAAATLPVMPGNTYNLTVGTNGYKGVSGAASQGGTSGGNGSPSFFGNPTAGATAGAKVLANGGGGGVGPGTQTGFGYAGGAGGSTTGDVGTIQISGTNGTASVTGSSGAGGNAPNRSTPGGSGGAAVTSGNGSNYGNSPGGGGGGGLCNTVNVAGGFGGAGQVQISYDAPATTVRVESAMDGSANTNVPAQMVPAGNSITSYAIARDASGNYLTNTFANWVLTNITGGVVSGDLVASADTRSAIFTAHASGSARILAVGNATNLIASGVITVTTATGTQVQVEAASDGSGTAVLAQTIPTGGSITNFAILRNGSGAFLQNTPASWVLTNITGGVNSGDLVMSPDTKSAVFTAHSAGSAQILAIGSATALIASGVITVVPHCTVGIRLSNGAGGNTDYQNAPNSYPVCKSGTTYSMMQTPPTATNVFKSNQAIVEIGLYSGTNFDGANFVSQMQTYENQGWNVYGVYIYREIWLTATNGPIGGAYTNDWRILEQRDINNIRTAVANSTLKCKNSMRLIQLLGSGPAYFQSGSVYAFNNINFPTFPPDELEYLRTNFDGVGLEVHIGYDKTSPLALMAMADIAQWCATNSKTAFVFMGGGVNTYTNLPTSQLTYETLWQEILAKGISYRSNDIIYWRQGARAGNQVPESASDTLSYQQRWVINALAGSALFVSDVADQIVNNATTSLIPFAAGEADLPGGAITVKATSSNQMVVTNQNLVITGRGFDRMLAIAPNPAQSGNTTVTLTVSDGVLTVTNSFQLTVTTFQTNNAVVSGPINTNTTWGITPPIAGDHSDWQTDGNTINMTQNATDSFYGDTFEIQGNGTFAPGMATANLTLNNLTLSGGTITMANNGGLTLHLNGGQLTLNNGTLKHFSSGNVTVFNAVLAGNGTINISGSSISGGEVNLNPNPFSGPYVNPLGFTGVFKVATNGVLELPYIIPDDASFSLNLSGTGLYANTENIAVTSLVINGTNFPPGVYTYSSFSPGQQAFLRNTNGVITVVASANTPPVLAPIANQTIIAGQTLTITNLATDTNVPTQALTFNLLNPPSKANINPTSGVFIWRPTIAQSPSTNSMSVVVTDNGTRPLSATQSFTVTVNQPENPSLTNVNLSHGLFKFTVTGDNGPDYTVLVSCNLVDWLPVWTNSAAVPPFNFTESITNSNHRFYRVLLGP